jgi:LysM repeat protein
VQKILDYAKTQNIADTDANWPLNVRNYLEYEASYPRFTVQEDPLGPPNVVYNGFIPENNNGGPVCTLPAANGKRQASETECGTIPAPTTARPSISVLPPSSTSAISTTSTTSTTNTTSVLPPTITPNPPCTQVYVVVAGDTCYSIWTKFGITEADLYAWNYFLNANCNLTIGQVLCVAWNPATATYSYIPMAPSTTTSIAISVLPPSTSSAIPIGTPVSGSATCFKDQPVNYFVAEAVIQGFCNQTFTWPAPNQPPNTNEVNENAAAISVTAPGTNFVTTLNIYPDALNSSVAACIGGIWPRSVTIAECSAGFSQVLSTCKSESCLV